MRWRFFPLLGLLGAAWSCNGVSDPSPTGERARLAQNRARWRAQQISSYRFQYRQLCFCLTEATQPVLITVRSGAVVEVVRLDSGQPVDPAWQGFYRSVEQMFDVVQEAIDRDADELRVEYDDRLGYPRHVFVDRLRQVADEEITLEASNLARLGS